MTPQYVDTEGSLFCVREYSKNKILTDFCLKKRCHCERNAVERSNLPMSLRGIEATSRIFVF